MVDVVGLSGRIEMKISIFSHSSSPGPRGLLNN